MLRGQLHPTQWRAAKPPGRVCLIDGGHHVCAHVDKGTGEVIVGWGCVAGFSRALALGVLCDEAQPGDVGGDRLLEDLVQL